MRFVLFLILFMALPLATLAKPGVKIDNVSEIEKQYPPIRMNVSRGSTQSLASLSDFDLEEVMTGLGKISDITSDGETKFFTLDPVAGRIWQIQDRNKDGQPEHRQVIATGFKAPSAITFMNGFLYVADIEALWKVTVSGERSVLAPLKHAQSDGRQYNLMAAPDMNRLILGFNKLGGGARLVSVAPFSGTAEKLVDLSLPLSALSRHAGGALWAAGKNHVGTVGQTFGHERYWTDLGTSGTITELLLQDKNNQPDKWPRRLDNHILATQSGPGAHRIIAIPTQFGQISDTPIVFVDGFLSPSGRTAWGRPGAMVMDKRGLFFVDEWRGSIWRLSVKRPEPVAIVKDPVVEPVKPVQAVQEYKPQTILGSRLVTGSQIGDNATTINSASTIKTGSTIIKRHDENKAKAEKEATRKKKLEQKPAYNLD